MSDDTIRRQMAIDALKKQQAYFPKEDAPMIYYEYNHAIEAIEQLPSVQPDWNEMVVICDCCGHAIQVKRQ